MDFPASVIYNVGSVTTHQAFQVTTKDGRRIACNFIDICDPFDAVCVLFADLEDQIALHSFQGA